MSCALFSYIVTQYSLDFSEEDIIFVQELIRGRPRNYKKKWLFDIVHNSRNSVDVDKFDYLSRDGYFLGIVKSNCDIERFLHHSKVIGNEICFHKKECYDLYELFHTRYSLFKRAYTHRVFFFLLPFLFVLFN